jgi:type II secretion system protein I
MKERQHIMKSHMKSNGFTLIETLIALVILAIALLALAGLMVTTTRNNSFGGHITEAATFAQDKLEEFRAVSWGSILSGNDQKNGSNGINYQRNCEVVTSVDGNLKTVTLNITWKDRNDHMIQVLSVINKKE